MNFFYTTDGNGIGLTYLRVQLYPDTSDCAALLGSDKCVSAPGGTIADSELADAQMAVADGATVWASEWSPPGSMKSNGAFATGGSFYGSTSNYTSLASIQASFVTLLTGTLRDPNLRHKRTERAEHLIHVPLSDLDSTAIPRFYSISWRGLSQWDYSSTKIMVCRTNVAYAGFHHGVFRTPQP